MIEADRFVRSNDLPRAASAAVMTYVQQAFMPHDDVSFSWRTDLLSELPVGVRAAAVAAMVSERRLHDAFDGASLLNGLVGM